MNTHFLCPHCKGHLKVGDYIVFTTKNKAKKKGLLLLHPELGNYTSIKHPEYITIVGEQISFYCPLCHHSLESDFDENLVYVHMIDETNQSFDIYFSRVSGEKSTFRVTGDTVEASGEHADKYTWFKMPEKFRQYIRK